jgi:hypothetical protein
MEPTLEVRWCPSNETIGHATTELGAVRLCHTRISGLLGCERVTARKAEFLDGITRWACGPQLKER